MKTRLGIIFALLCSSSAVLADRVTTGPDFVNAAPQRHIDRSLVASPDGMGRIEPYTVVPFNLDSAQLTNDGYDEIRSAAHWMIQHPRHKLVLEGHADALGSSNYNEDLATRRMATVRMHMLRWGISSDRIVMITFGENESLDLENPLFPANRKVVMYATQLAPQAVIAMVKESRDALYASWTERGVLMQMQHGLTTPTRTFTTRR